jgi:hypothetical protein
MDESFFLRAQRLLGERRAPTLDHQALCSRVMARQAETPTAQASAEAASMPTPAGETETLIMLVLNAPGWRGAAHKQGGCFNRAAAKRRLNTR